jgi:gamma-F420-2:alpha-L-glutamate ligase
MLVRFPVDPHLVAQQIGFPCVIKLLVSWLDRSQSLILQQYIGTRPGKDLRVWVIGGQVVGAMLRSSTDGSFKANISRGGDGQAFPLNPELERLARDSAAALNLDIAGVDLLFDGDGYSICEVNSAWLSGL